MRLLEKFDRIDAAQLLSDVLSAAGIESTVRSLGEGFSVWVHNDDQMEAARSVLEEFQRSQGAPHWFELGRLGRERRQSTERERAGQRPVIINARERLERRQRTGIVTLILIGISVAVAIVTKLGDSSATVRYFTINDFRVEGVHIAWLAGLDSVAHGQVWRVVSPIFLHFGILHLFFNMWMLKDLGTAIEHIYSRLYLVLIVFVVGTLSNLLQYFWTGSPMFGGMSGVVYGLFGFLWLRGRFDPACPLKVNRTTVIWLMLWYVLCLTGYLGPVANAAHTGGVVVGAAWGFLSSGYVGRHLRR
jgi:GlpG protein